MTSGEKRGCDYSTVDKFKYKLHPIWTILTYICMTLCSTNMKKNQFGK